jgi:hypothetical protein
MKKILLGSSALPFAESVCQKSGLECIILPFSKRISDSVKGHADSLVFLKDGALITFDDYYLENRPLFDSLKIPIITTNEYYSDTYPYDILFNAIEINGTVIGRCENISALIKEGKSEIRVPQGYARCSTLLAGVSCAVTADLKLSRALTELSVDTLLIRSGHIILEGYDYGFIGGASIVFENTVFFFGRIEDHPDYYLIKEHLEKHGYSLSSLSDAPLTDCGGAIII